MIYSIPLVCNRAGTTCSTELEGGVSLLNNFNYRNGLIAADL